MKAPVAQAKEQAIQALMVRLGYQFTNPVLLHLALTHRSCDISNNERLEFLGDAIVNCVIAKALYGQFPKAKEGQLSLLRASLVKGVTLAAIAKELGLGECLKLGIGERKSGGQERESILADAVEAIIGAIYLDGGMSICEDCILTWFSRRLQLLDLDRQQKDAKTRLQEYLQARGQHLPVYELVRLTGQDHKQVFVMSCTVSMLGKTMLAQASSRRIGEQKAAAKALQLLEQSNL